MLELQEKNSSVAGGKMLMPLRPAIYTCCTSGGKNWTKFSEDDDGNGYFIDTDSITDVGNDCVSVWTKQEGYPIYMKQQYLIDFSHQIYLTVSVLFYNSDGTLHYDGSFPFDWAYITPNSGLLYYVYKFLESWRK